MTHPKSYWISIALFSFIIAGLIWGYWHLLATENEFENYFSFQKFAKIKNSKKVVVEWPLCEIKKEYLFGNGNEMKCICPEGYTIDIINTSLEKCIDNPKSNCQKSIRECVKKIGDFPKFSISELNTENFEAGNYNTEGYVILTEYFVCPPCPENADCVPCYPIVVISDNNKILANNRYLTNNEIKLGGYFKLADIRKLEIGKKYIFSLELSYFNNKKNFYGRGFEETK